MGWAYQASAPSLRKSWTAGAASLESIRGFWQVSQWKTVMGTPQTRWREMHQSGRVAIMLVMRSSPHLGDQ